MWRRNCSILPTENEQWNFTTAMFIDFVSIEAKIGFTG